MGSNATCTRTDYAVDAYLKNVIGGTSFDDEITKYLLDFYNERDKKAEGEKYETMDESRHTGTLLRKYDIYGV